LAKSNYLTGAALCCALAALAHLGCIVFGADWYRFFGAGEQMALMAERGDWHPTIVTTILVLILMLWALYALSGAGIIRRLPLLRTALCVISAIFLLRGLAFVAIMPLFPENSVLFWLVSSTICLFIGALFALGTVKAWHYLSITSDKF